MQTDIVFLFLRDIHSQPLELFTYQLTRVPAARMDYQPKCSVIGSVKLNKHAPFQKIPFVLPGW